MTLTNRFAGDPVGYAITDRVEYGFANDILIISDQSDDDVFPVDYFFRTYELMPGIEKKALSLCAGKILDVGAGGGCHSAYLQDKGFDVLSIDTSAGAVEAMKKAGLNALQTDLFDFDSGKFDTILILMNGIGIAGSVDDLPQFLERLKSVLNVGGKIYCDSTDIAYLFTDADGSLLIDLNGRYYGEMQFNMIYKDVESGWFSWLYIDFENLAGYAAECGLKCTLVENGPSNNYLACLEHQ